MVTISLAAQDAQAKRGNGAGTDYNAYNDNTPGVTNIMAGNYGSRFIFPSCSVAEFSIAEPSQRAPVITKEAAHIKTCSLLLDLIYWAFLISAIAVTADFTTPPPVTYEDDFYLGHRVSPFVMPKNPAGVIILWIFWAIFTGYRLVCSKNDCCKNSQARAGNMHNMHDMKKSMQENKHKSTAESINELGPMFDALKVQTVLAQIEVVCSHQEMRSRTVNDPNGGTKIENYYETVVTWSHTYSLTENFETKDDTVVSGAEIVKMFNAYVDNKTDATDSMVFIDWNIEARISDVEMAIMTSLRDELREANKHRDRDIFANIIFKYNDYPPAKAVNLNADQGIPLLYRPLITYIAVLLGCLSALDFAIQYFSSRCKLHAYKRFNMLDRAFKPPAALAALRTVEIVGADGKVMQGGMQNLDANGNVLNTTVNGGTVWGQLPPRYIEVHEARLRLIYTQVGRLDNLVHITTIVTMMMKPGQEGQFYDELEKKYGTLPVMPGDVLPSAKRGILDTMPGAASPQHWQMVIDPATEKVFYANTVTKETSWTAPPGFVASAPLYPSEAGSANTHQKQYDDELV